MATNLKLIELAREVTPSEALHSTYFHDRPSGLMILSEPELRKKVEWQRGVTKPMTWEEWLDVREAWCRYYDAHLCTIVQGDLTTMNQMAELASRNGGKYLLLDIVQLLPPVTPST